jgi:4-coumarate--CoA ligase
MTESGGIVTLQQVFHKNGSCGTVLTNSEIKIVDPDNGKTLGTNQTGEVCIKTTTVMNGYYRNPEATKHMFDEEGKKFNGILSTMMMP